MPSNMPNSHEKYPLTWDDTTSEFLDRTHLLCEISLGQQMAFEIMSRKSASRGVENLNTQGFSALINRATEDKLARIKKAVLVQTLRETAEKLEKVCSIPAGHLFNASRLPPIEWDKVYLDLLDAANYLHTAAAMVKLKHLRSVPVDDD